MCLIASRPLTAVDLIAIEVEGGGHTHTHTLPAAKSTLLQLFPVNVRYPLPNTVPCPRTRPPPFPPARLEGPGHKGSVCRKT